jgi:DNA polymerase-3 subunit delta'
MRWETIVGQERAVKLLRSALTQDHVHHAYLLAGPAGTGKELIARTFAQAANCLGDARPCGVCEHCKAIERGNFPDVSTLLPQSEAIARGLINKADLEGSPSKEIRVDDIRALAKRLSLAPLRGRRKVALIVPADAMNERAQNTLLKTLEEPPPATTFLLISANPDALLPTIRSRCARVQLAPVSEELIREHLARDGISPAEAAERAARAQGSFSKAFAEQGERRELLAAVEQALGAADERPSLDLAEAFGERGSALEVAEAVQAWTRDLLVAQTGAPDEVLELRALRPLLTEVGERVSPVSLLGQATLCADVIEALEQNGNGRLQLERLFLGARELRRG